MSNWYENSIFYHMYPLGMTGAPRDNSEPQTVHRFDELIQWILHIHSLGCNAIYIGPLFESTGHGYDTKDFRLVDRRLGDNRDFARFVSLCHEQQIRVVVDGVFNHTGREFFAFRDIQKNKWDSPYKDWYKGVSFDWNSPLGDPFGYEAWQGHFELPCLNLYNPEVKNWLLDSVRFWVNEFDIDGIRLDCANILDFNFMKELRQAASSLKEDFWLMGEVIHGDYSRWVNPEMLHSVTNYELHKSLYSGFNDHNFFEIAHNVKRLEAIGRQLYTFVDNHDEDRIASKLKDPAHLPLIYAALLTLPGIPSIYYGGEWAIRGQRSRTSDLELRPAISPDQFSGLHSDFTDQLGKMIQIHASESALHGGKYQELLLKNRQYAFCRCGEDGLILTVLNNDSNPAAVSVPVPVGADEALCLLHVGASAEAAADETASVLPVENGRLELTLGANSGMILKIKGEH